MSDLQKELEELIIKRTNAEKLLDFLLNTASEMTITLGNIKL